LAGAGPPTGVRLQADARWLTCGYRDHMTSLGHVRTWWRSLDRRVLDATVAVLLLVVTVIPLATRSLVAGQRPSDIWAYLLAVALCVPFVFHRRFPVAAITVACCALVLYAVGRYNAYPGLPIFVLVAGVSLHSTRRRALLAAGLAAVALSVAVWLQPESVATASTWVASLLAVAVAWLWGENLRNRRARWAAMEERARRLEAEREERDRQAVIDERLRIARELHDVVAHSMSVIAVQSGVANHVIDSRPAQARQALATIEATSRSALVELRRLLGVLRLGDDPVASLEPNPGMAELGRLAEQIRSAGVEVELKVEGEPSDLPPGVDLSAFRIAQEGLTNVLKHGGNVARMLVRYSPGAVAVEIADDGRARAVDEAPADGTGHGLIGMRERVAVFGGELTAGPAPGGGYRLAARLPYAAAAGAGEGQS
jgi:signal transduction histidine kinase